VGQPPPLPNALTTISPANSNAPLSCYQEGVEGRTGITIKRCPAILNIFLQELFQYLGAFDRAKCASVSKRWEGTSRQVPDPYWNFRCISWSGIGGRKNCVTLQKTNVDDGKRKGTMIETKFYASCQASIELCGQEPSAWSVVISGPVSNNSGFFHGAFGVKTRLEDCEIRIELDSACCVHLHWEDNNGNEGHVQDENVFWQAAKICIEQQQLGVMSKWRIEEHAGPCFRERLRSNEAKRIDFVLNPVRDLFSFFVRGRRYDFRLTEALKIAELPGEYLDVLQESREKMKWTPTIDVMKNRVVITAYSRMPEWYSKESKFFIRFSRTGRNTWGD